MFLRDGYLTKVTRICEGRLYLFNLKDGSSMLAYVLEITFNDCIDLHVRWLDNSNGPYDTYSTVMLFSEIDEAFLIKHEQLIEYICDVVPDLYNIIVNSMMTTRLGIYLSPNVIVDTKAYQKEIHKICAGGIAKNGYPKEHKSKVCYYSRLRKR